MSQTFDPFAMLDLPRRYAVDEAELHRRFVSASSATHPDRFADPLDQADATERASLINQAYRVLRDPMSRAEALLKLMGEDPGDAGALPPDLLMQVMEAREEMEDAAAGDDAEAMRRLTAWAEAQRAERLGAIADAFAAIDAGGAADHRDRVRAIRLHLNALRYFRRMLEQTSA
jgi:molecular chaperone HscB